MIFIYMLKRNLYVYKEMSSTFLSLTQISVTVSVMMSDHQLNLEHKLLIF